MFIQTLHARFCLSSRPWSPSAPPEAGKLVRNLSRKEGFPTRSACGNDRKRDITVKCLFLWAVLFLIPAGVVQAASDHIMPYGDYSQWCSAYGTCKENLGPEDAEKAIHGYFADKRLRAANIRHRGRFTEAEIYRNGRMVDKILFDRKTGRMRSTY